MQEASDFPKKNSIPANTCWKWDQSACTTPKAALQYCKIALVYFFLLQVSIQFFTKFIKRLREQFLTYSYVCKIYCKYFYVYSICSPKMYSHTCNGPELSTEVARLAKVLLACRSWNSASFSCHQEQVFTYFYLRCYKISDEIQQQKTLGPWIWNLGTEW